MLTLIVGVLASAVWFIDPLGRYFVGNPLSLEAHVPAIVQVNEPFEVDMRISNLLPERSTRIYIEISKEYLEAAVPGMPLPPPRRITQSSEKVLFEYGPIGPSAVLPIRMRFVQHKPGKADFVARIYAPSSHLFREVRTPISAVEFMQPQRPEKVEQTERRNNTVPMRQ